MDMDQQNSTSRPSFWGKIWRVLNTLDGGDGKMEVGWRPVGLWAAPSSGRIALHPSQREELSEVCGLWGEGA